MGRWFSYAIAQLAAHTARDERLNVGIVIFDNDRLDIRPAKNLDKIRAISSALDVSEIRSSLLSLDALDRTSLNDGLVGAEIRLRLLNNVSAFGLSSLGRFEAHSDAAYDAQVSSLLAKFVEPEPAPLRRTIRRSKLLSSMKSAFKREGVLARPGEDLSAHRLVSGWNLAQGLSADLVLKNGAMHVIETIDAQSDDVSKRKVISDIGIAALVLEQARMVFGDNGTKARLVYSASASNEEIVKPSLRAAEHQGAELVNWASDDARRKFIVDVATLATPLETAKSVYKNVNASSQTRFAIN